MTVSIVLLVLVVGGALVFEYINGFHDAANAIATVVSTKVLTPRQAVVYGAALEFTGALTGTHVAKTIGAGIVDPSTITLHVIFCALCAAIIWNLITWFFGLPSSSSHALIGGLIGAAVVNAGWGCVRFLELVDKVIAPMFMAPVIGFVTGLIVMAILLRIFYKANQTPGMRQKSGRSLPSVKYMSLTAYTTNPPAFLQEGVSLNYLLNRSE